MSIYDDAKEMGVMPVESEYETEFANNFKWKMKAFAENFYGPLAGKPVEFLPEEYFERYYDRIRENGKLEAKREEDPTSYYAEVTKDMFYRGGQLVWKMFQETKKFTETEEDHRGTVLVNLKCGLDFKPAHILKKDGIKAVEEALEGIYSVMLMEPVTVPETEEELKEFAKVSFESGFTVIWRYLATLNIESDRKKDKINNFTLRKNKGKKKKREKFFG